MENKDYRALMALAFKASCTLCPKNVKAKIDGIANLAVTSAQSVAKAEVMETDVVLAMVLSNIFEHVKKEVLGNVETESFANRDASTDCSG